MSTQKTEKFKLTWIEAALLFAVLLEFCFVLFANLKLIPVTMDNDNAKLFTHAIEIWNTKQIFIPNWVNETMLELDTSLLFALPIYGMTGDIYLSFGLANIIILLAFYFFTASLLKRMNQPLYVRIIACGLLTIPYSFGQLLYFNMMFFSGGFYGIKVLLPFMLIWLMTTPEKERKILFWIIAVITTGFTFLFSISTGPYSLLCAIFPVVITYLWFEIGKMSKGKELFSKWLFSIKNLILYAQGIAALAGISIGNRMQVDSTGSNMRILDYHDFVTNAQYLISDYFELLGSFPNGAEKIMSLKGISSFAHFLLALLALIAIIVVSAQHFKRLKATNEIAMSQESGYYLVMVFLWNTLVLLVCEIMGQCRYLLMGLVPMIPMIAIFYKDLVIKIRGTVQRGILHLAFFGLIAVAAILSDHQIMKDDCNPPMASENAKYNEVVKILDSYPEKQVFLWNDPGYSEYLRVYDYKSGREYLAYMPEEGGVFVHDYYEDRTDASTFADDHILLISDYLGSINDLPEYLKNCYEEVDGYQNIHIYRAKENRMDGVSGFRTNAHSIDYCYTPGYTILSGAIDENGTLVAMGAGESILNSPWFYVDTPDLSITMDYEVIEGDGEVGRLEVLNGDTQEVVAAVSLEKGGKQAQIRENLDGQNIVLRVIVNDGATIRISKFTYDR